MKKLLLIPAAILVEVAVFCVSWGTIDSGVAPHWLHGFAFLNSMVCIGAAAALLFFVFEKKP